ncbi:transport protein Avl9-domain-containing protein [Halteromyces radiatus]|uniref:transport protein Avl9-domain-containing protein n=1 Tax=Halteromyces radiatus TaxID=101107 RepID=UPI00221E454D|nr:transport protein Avl9-domain-containing protein [Halteromyces radiatus]KAI8096783.1 transport protein Avl9-domain-containing protein [Halteromyces radiatus]
MDTTTLDKNKDHQQIAAILVVGFHHAYGPVVEFCHPPLPQQPQNDQTSLEKLELPEDWNFLPFLALPDGAHQKDEDFAYFHLPPVPGWSVAETTLFGISCNRQIATKDLLVTTPDITRSIVQKAVVVLARQPIFGPLRQKLAVITAAWFSQRDFTQLGILYNLYNNLTNTFCGPIDDSTLYMGTSLRELLHKFKYKTLILLKLLLLEKRILFYGYPVERLCTFEYSLISLVPGLLRSLQDSGAPELDISNDDLQQIEAKELENGNKASLLRYMGLPLRVFEKGSFFQPYLPLQQINMLSSSNTKSYVVGTTNQIFFHHKSDINIDVLVNVENGTLEFYDQKLASIVHPTLADRRWMEKIVKVVHDTWDDNDPARPMQNTYLGSDDYLRARFEEYVLSLLSSTKHAQDTNVLASINGTALAGMGSADAYSTQTTEDVMLDDDKERNYVLDYGIKWWINWRETVNFKLWNQYTDHEIYEIVEPGHPGMGHISIVDIQNTLSNRFRDLQLRNNLGPLGKTLSKAMSGGAKAVSSGRVRLLRGVDALWNDLPSYDHSTSKSPSHQDPDNANQNPIHAHTSNRNDSFSLSSPQRQDESAETTSQQASRLFSNFSTFLSRKQKEFTLAIEVGLE